MIPIRKIFDDYNQELAKFETYRKKLKDEKKHLKLKLKAFLIKK